MNNLHVMVDLETMGTRSTSAIVAIGAARFDEKGVGETFYQVVDLESSMDAGLTVDASTIMWWLGQSEAARKALAEDAEPLQTALVRFTCWLDTLHVGYDSGPESVMVWGNGASFDNVILANAYHALEMPVPWKFWNDQCYRTLRRQFPHLHTSLRSGVAHKAIDDAVHQAMCASKMFAAIARTPRA